MQKIELAKKIKRSIEDSTIPLWFPNLTLNLVEIGWQSLKDEYGVNRSNYCTSKIMLRTISAPCSVSPIKDKLGNKLFFIELLPRELINNYSDSKIDFYIASDLKNQTISNCLLEAIELISTVSSLSKSIFKLVRSLHLIRPDDDNYDVSFSEPHIPFSIFVSVPKSRIKADFLRVAEAIVHEAMHLQLSLIERVVPLINSNEQKFYSPWKDEYRHSQGILHALYVFRVIESFYKYIELIHDFPLNQLSFLKERRSQILLQINEINEFSNSSDLTEFGLLLTNRLMS